ncbi:hypothetical protein WAI453_011985 [Rhynchosporium graminicola]|uniref:Integral membrane protein n=1 Tax=Rhynchosporium graminicola TaxID=2792576 RepID=A0A1E1KJJ7_9HELO|nr:uncharacterized protein RCO7_08915 [Rhynchosporium commune]
MESHPQHREQRQDTSRLSSDNDVEQRLSNLPRRPIINGEQIQREGQIRSAGVYSTAEPVYEPISTQQRQHTTIPLQRINCMFTRFPWRDMSFMTGFLFAIGSAFFIANGFSLVLSLTRPDTVYEGQLYWTGAAAVIGGMIFILGGFAAVLEALNIHRGDNSNCNVIDSVNIDDNVWDPMTDDIESLRQNNKLVVPWRDIAMDLPLCQTIPSSNSSNSSPSAPNTHSYTITSATPLSALYGSSAFMYWPNTPHLRTIFLHDICFISSLIQSVGTFIFMFAIITAFPSVIDLTNTTHLYVLNLFPATLGGVLFITASVLQLLTTQEKWYIPNPKSVAWHACFWNVVGSVGFMLAGALAFLGTGEGTLQSGLASLWGSCAFMVGGILQWYLAMGNVR